jgi:hypothetical protein
MVGTAQAPLPTLRPLGHPLSRVMTTECESAFSRHTAPEFCNHVRASEERGRRECRVSDAPVAAQNAVVVHRFTGLNRHSLRNGFTASFVLSPVTGFVVTVIPEKR